ncbi:hypothetical protein M2322_002462 [Rhodoblastus acidophilus]|uniref:hypothetical protein n=1 Tax=Rhodoblastus acidophilus TaxID=1074 RepID=UPI002225B53A|nr:hypothetical protein [Rhodoblastus acidophilus]MCW2316908.1 hypothetical protein [Rhodoblastus acidophilus]
MKKYSDRTSIEALDLIIFGDRNFTPEFENIKKHIEEDLIKDIEGRNDFLFNLRRIVGLSPKYRAIDSKNYKISKSVLERLLVRHAILNITLKKEDNYLASKAFIPNSERFWAAGNSKVLDDQAVLPNLWQNTVAHEYSSNSLYFMLNGVLSFLDKRKRIAPGVSNLERHVVAEKNIRTYKLAVTDLFVEKAIAYLEHDSRLYKNYGMCLFFIGSVPLVVAIVVSFSKFYYLTDRWSIFSFGSDRWYFLIQSFISGFTFYGFLVLITVYSWRFGKAMIEQSERLSERRHALRQGRLFIHLNNGEMSASDLEKAFDWNVAKTNAFTGVPTEASAPWGGVIKEALKAIPEIFKTSKGGEK